MAGNELRFSRSDYRSMKKLSITLSDETAAWLRSSAAERKLSVSAFIRALLRERMRESREYEQAMWHFLAKGPFKLKGARQRYPERDELYDRTRHR
jgi:hypothetical protein